MGKMQSKNNVELPEEMPPTSSENYWPVYHKWKALAFSISKEDYESLDDAPKQQIKSIILKYEHVGIPMTPRLAGQAISDKRAAARQIENLGLKQAEYKPDGSENFGVKTMIGK